MEEKDLTAPQTEPAAPEQPEGGRRLDPDHKGGKGKLPLIIAAAVVVGLLAAYLGLCGVVSAAHHALPNTTVLGTGVGGMNTEEGAAAVYDACVRRYENMEVPILVGDQSVTLSAREARLTVDRKAIEQSLRWWEEGSFFSSGWRYLAGLFGKETALSCPVTLEDEDYVNRVMNQAELLAGAGAVEATWTVEETEESAQLLLTKGRTGYGIVREALFAQVKANLEQGIADPITATVVVLPPKEPDFSAIADDVARKAFDATLDVETDEIIPHQNGLALNTTRAEAVYGALQEGETGRVELIVKEPEVTTLDLRATLFRDILGEGHSRITGDAGRVNNVRLSAAACDGVILLPGEQMSYNQTTGQRTTAKGYREADGYTARGVEKMVGGGVCQPSSTLYWACLNANLEIVNRKNHMYSVSYMPEGIDATVSWPNLDYVFANNTKYPIKISMTIEKGQLFARIYGTKLDDTYVEMESVRLSTTPAGVTYQADPEVARGTTKTVQGAHTGKKVEVYRNTYAGDGTRLSRTLLTTDTYKPSNKIVAYNPLDGVPEAGILPIPDPSVPVEPTAPPTDPSVPTVEPTAPPTDPSVPTVEPTAPPTDPGTPSVEPTPTAPPPPEGIPLE